ncbi:MAG: YggT family protein [Candidatus Aminicenantes bacterium]|nr:YggT family protein [Candidatus Aminicenantes bacterium]
MIFSNFIKALAQFFHLVIQAYIIVIIVRAVISWAGNIPPNRFIYILRRLTDPVFRVVHRYVPFSIIGGIDISPIIIIVLLYFIDNFFTGVLMEYADRLSLGG